MSFRDEVVGTLQADVRSLRQFWDEKNLFGLSDGVWDLIVLPAVIGLGVVNLVLWHRAAQRRGRR